MRQVLALPMTTTLGCIALRQISLGLPLLGRNDSVLMMRVICISAVTLSICICRATITSGFAVMLQLILFNLVRATVSESGLIVRGNWMLQVELLVTMYLITLLLTVKHSLSMVSACLEQEISLLDFRVTTGLLLLQTAPSGCVLIAQATF